MRQVNKGTVAMLLFISTLLYIHGASTKTVTSLNEANGLLLTAADGKASTDCDCGPYGICKFENGQKKCVCAPSAIKFEGKCIECDCGRSSKSCSLSTNGTKICVCESGFVDADGLCTECDCGDNGLCEIESGQKKCICSPGYVEVREKCQECECGEATYSCVLDSSGKKKCTCLPKYEENNGTCDECYCGRFGRCMYEDGLRKCSCSEYYSERNGTCEFCSCGDKSSNCHFDSNLDKRCECYKGYAERDGGCEECDCGSYGSCVFENGKKRCKCKSDTVEINGWCSYTTTVKEEPDTERSTFIISTTTEVPITRSTIQTSTNRACDCGKNSINCHLNRAGENICDCHCGYLQNNGRCEECNCGPYGGCTFENGRKKCFCMSFAVEVNGVCVDFGNTSASTSDSSFTSTIDSSTSEECDCGPRAIFCFENSEKKCMCDSFSTEKDGKCVDCYCGENSKSCSFNRKGEKICKCKSGYSQVFGFCYDCNCGENANSCSYTKDGTKECKCGFGYTQRNGKCSAICSESKCLHGICEIVENDFKCRCDKGFTGRHCEEQIQIKPVSDKQDVWTILILIVTLAIFVLLSGMFCFWTRMLSKLSRK